MQSLSLTIVNILILLLSPSGWAQSPERIQAIEREKGIRSLGTLRVINRWGGVKVSTWSQSRVKAVSPAAPVSFEITIEERKEEGEVTEVNVIYGRSLQLKERMVTKDHVLTPVPLEIKAPSGMALEIWTNEGDVSVSHWRGDVSIRKMKGPVRLEEIKGKSARITCPECQIDLKKIQANVEIEGGGGAIHGVDIRAEKFFVQTESAPIELSQISADTTLVTKSGKMTLRNLKGALDFRTERGLVEVLGVDGSVTGVSRAGDVRVEVARWSPRDKGFIETQTGGILFTLPKRASLTLEVEAHRVRPYSIFQLQDDARGREGFYLRGNVGFGGELFRLRSSQGKIAVLQGSWGGI